MFLYFHSNHVILIKIGNNFKKSSKFHVWNDVKRATFRGLNLFSKWKK